MLDHERARLRPGLLILADKGFAGRDVEQLVAGYGAAWRGLTALMNRTGSGRWAAGASGSKAPSTPQRPARPGTPWRPDRARGGGPGCQRLLALAAAIWWNWQLGAPDKRSLVTYDH